MKRDDSDIQTLKEGLKATWTAGDWGMIARGLERSAEGFLERVGVSPGERLLDVACGNGQLAVPAARAGAEAAGIDIAENWIEQARARAAAGNLDIRFDVGDVEAMPYEDERFDTVISLIGAMFAPRPELAVSEMLRVCRPGGRIVMGNWTPEGLVGRFFKIVGKYVPPPAMPSPLLWGDEDTVRERLTGGATDLRMSRQYLHFDYPMPASEIAAHYFEHFGPTRKAHEALDEPGREALASELSALWVENNQASDGTTQVDAEILEVVARRR